MPSKIKPIPVRLGDERLARLDEFARTEGTSRHAAMLVLIDRGLDSRSIPLPLASDNQPAAVERNKTKARKAKAGGVEPPSTPPPPTQAHGANAVRVGPAPRDPQESIRAGNLVPLDTSMVPELGTFERRPLQKASAQPKRKWKI